MDDAERERAKRILQAAQDSPAELESGVPDLGLDRDWSPEVLRWWERVWAASFAWHYIGMDMPALLFTALVLDQWVRNPRADLVDEIRERAASHGLTPESRVTLGWSKEPVPSDADVESLLAAFGHGLD